MEIGAIYAMSKAVSVSELHELLEKLNEQFEIDTVQCAGIRNDFMIDVRVAFSDPEKVKAGVSESVGVDDEGYFWVRLANPALMGIPHASLGDRWYAIYTRGEAPMWFEALAKQATAG